MLDPFFEVSITDLNAVGDGEADDTDAFEQAIHLIQQNGGGRLVIAGLTPASLSHFRIRPLNLTSHLILHVAANVTISAIADENRWPLIPPLPSYGQGRDHPGFRFTSVFHGEHLTNVTMEGSSTTTSILDGQGEYWWKQRREGTDKHTRGHLIEFMYSSDIRIRNLRLLDSPFWTNHFYDCDNVHVQNVHIYADNYNSRNTDGWDPDSSRNVLIEDSSYHGGDDCVAIKSGWDCYGLDYGKPSVNITIRNVTCDGRFAGIAIGTEMSGGVENVTVENVFFTQANSLAKIKTGNTRGGYVRDISYRNLTAVGELTKFPLHIDMYHYHNQPNPACGDDWRPPNLPVIRDISYKDIDGMNATITANETFHFIGMSDSPIQNVRLENVHLPSNTNGAPAWNCTAVSGTVVNGSVEPWPPCHQMDIIDPPQQSSSSTTTHHRMGMFASFPADAEALIYVCVLGILVLVTAFALRRKHHSTSYRRVAVHEP